ncbi:MAG: MBL fold metallo-hydrolase [Clostridiales bacterium]|jgi:phosphoribosyl 1,2-cyclic phosphodiesterase|nr:MBL fold metallo-hydrolase [Clostridiales bacterium]
MSALRFCPIASGSSGNSTYIGTGDTHILIDAGISGKRAELLLEGLSVSAQSLNAIFITHEHADHILGAGVLSRRFDVPIYACENTWRKIDSRNLMGKIAPHNKKVFSYGQTVSVGDNLFLKPFQTPHDAAQPSGFNIFAEGRKISVATDMGIVTDTVREHIYGSDIMLLESNHDIEMLKNGPYPWQLKKRILGEYGHLSNAACGELITEIFSSKVKHIFLGHLSEENNEPALAFEAVSSILSANKIKPGCGFSLHLANRWERSYCVTYEKEFG